MFWMQNIHKVLGGGFNPFEKYERQIGNLPQIGVQIIHIQNQHLDLVYFMYMLTIGSLQNAYAKGRLREQIPTRVHQTTGHHSRVVTRNYERQVNKLKAIS